MGAHSIGLGAGAESRQWLKSEGGGRSMNTLTPVVQPFVSRDKMISQD